MSKLQTLKIHRENFDSLAAGVRTWDTRKDDRDYQAGDVIQLREIIDDGPPVIYTGREALAIVDRVWKGLPGLAEDFVILDLRLAARVRAAGERTI